MRLCASATYPDRHVNSLLEALLLGVIEGLTEFLPISSTGHLLIAQHWLGRRTDLFNVAIQAGAILAVTLVYRGQIRRLALNWREPPERDELTKLFGAFFITCVLGLAAKLLGAELPETVGPVATALIIGGLVIFAVERWASRQLHASSDLTWAVVVSVGVAQVVAGVFPGTSRSAAAIFAAMLAGMTARPRAAEFAFLVGIPTMLAATAYEVLKILMHGDAQGESWIELAVAFAVSAAVGFAAVKWLLKFISGHSFVSFAWYRIALGVALLLMIRTEV